MTPDGFSELAKLIPAPLILLDSAGRVMRASVGDGPRLWPEHPEERMLFELVEDPRDRVEQYVRSCRRSAQPLVGALTFRGQAPQPRDRCRCYGAGVVAAGGADRFVVIRVVSSHRSGEHDGFTALTERLELLDDVRRGRLQAADEIAQRERRLAYLLETTQDAVIFIDEAHDITRFNAAAERLFGYSRDEVQGKHVTMLMPEPHTSQHEAYIERYERTGEAHAIGRIREVSARRKDGRVVPIELSVTPLARGSRRYGAFIRDVSEREAMQQRLLEKERLAAVGTTAAMFAHEVANPLNGMFVHAQLLARRLDKAGAEDRIKNNADLIAHEIKRLMGLLEEFRGLSKRQELRFARTRVQDLVQELLHEQAPLYGQHNVEVVADLPESVPIVRVDRGKFKQAVLNLCKNAVEAMADGGTLTVRLSARPETVRLEIADTGCGIPEGVRVFEPFATTKEGGTGLGLPVVRQMMDAHGGTIDYESRPGQGTSFVLELPVAEADGLVV